MRDNFGFRKRFGHAFLCMNLPYTMSVDEAANATAALLPDVVTPYHYRNADGTLSNLTEFTDLVAQRAPSVDVDILNFYPYGPLTTLRR
jgi:L-ascorbate metabolism protein UlaG (beta-lactamase superfamily)